MTAAADRASALARKKASAHDAYKRVHPSKRPTPSAPMVDRVWKDGNP